MPVDLGVHFLDRGKMRQVPLVELHDQRDLLDPQPHLAQVVLKILVALDVRLEHLALRVRHEHHAVRPLQHELARRVVKHLTRDRVELDTRLHAADFAQLERQEIEEQRAIRLGRERKHLPLLDVVGD